MRPSCLFSSNPSAAAPSINLFISKNLIPQLLDIMNVDIKDRTIEMINKNDSLNHDNEIKELEILFRKIEK